MSITFINKYIHPRGKAIILKEDTYAYKIFVTSPQLHDPFSCMSAIPLKPMRFSITPISPGTIDGGLICFPYIRDAEHALSGMFSRAIPPSYSIYKVRIPVGARVFFWEHPGEISVDKLIPLSHIASTN